MHNKVHLVSFLFHKILFESIHIVNTYKVHCSCYRMQSAIKRWYCNNLKLKLSTNLPGTISVLVHNYYT